MNVNNRVGDIKRRFEVLHEINVNKSQICKNSPKLQTKLIKDSLPSGNSSCVNIQRDVASKSSRNTSSLNTPYNNRSNIKRTPAFRCEKVSRPPGLNNNCNSINKGVGKLSTERMKQFESDNKSSSNLSTHHFRNVPLSPSNLSRPTSSFNQQTMLSKSSGSHPALNKFTYNRNDQVSNIQNVKVARNINASSNKNLYNFNSKSSDGLSKSCALNKLPQKSVSNSEFSSTSKVSNDVFSKVDRIRSTSSASQVGMSPSSVNVDINRFNSNSDRILNSSRTNRDVLSANLDIRTSTNSLASNVNINNLNPVSLVPSYQAIDSSSLQDSVQAALRAPLPKGPPPKKPPRTFAHNIAHSQSHLTLNKLTNSSVPIPVESSDHLSSPGVSSISGNNKYTNIRPVRSKTESQIMLKKLENFFQSNQDETIVTPKRSREEADVDVQKKVHLLHSVRKGPLPEVPSQGNQKTISNSNVTNQSGSCFQSSNCTSSELSSYSNFYEKPQNSQSKFFVDFNSPNSQFDANSSKSLQKLHLNKSNTDDPIYAEIMSPNDWKSSGSSKLNVDVENISSISSLGPCIAPLTVSSPQSGLHYMCTPVDSMLYTQGTLTMHPKPSQSFIKSSNGHVLPPPARKFSSADEHYSINKMNLPDSSSKPIIEKLHLASLSSERNIQMLVNEAYSKPCWKKIVEVSSDSDSAASISEDFKENLKDGEKEQLTQVRKGYVRRVATRALSQKRPTQYFAPNFSHLFECLLLIGLDLDPARCKVPYIKSKYPPDVSPPAHIESLCFPDAIDWPPPPAVDSGNQCYTVIITSESAQRKYGYCKRIQPEGAPICLPLAYCIVTPYKANSFYYQLLGELESRHGQTEQNMTNFIKELYENAFPSSGQGVKVTPAFPSAVDQKFDKVEILKRPEDSRQDTDLSGMLSCIRLNIFVQLLSTLLHERKVILLSKFISVISMCVEGLQASLYPFQWPHVLVTVVPTSMQDLCEAPTPFIIGFLKPYHTSESRLPSLNNIEQVMVVDLDQGKVIQSVGDEMSILPSRVAKGLKIALQINLPTDTSTRNLLIAEALLRLFVELIGHYREFIFMNIDTQKKEFQREAFISCVESKSIRLFLDWFTETAMFNLFIESRLEPGSDSRGIFEKRCDEFAEEKDKVKGKNYKGLNKTVKNLGDRLKDWATLS